MYVCVCVRRSSDQMKILKDQSAQTTTRANMLILYIQYYNI